MGGPYDHMAPAQEAGRPGLASVTAKGSQVGLSSGLLPLAARLPPLRQASGRALAGDSGSAGNTPEVSRRLAGSSLGGGRRAVGRGCRPASRPLEARGTAGLRWGGVRCPGCVRATIRVPTLLAPPSAGPFRQRQMLQTRSATIQHLTDSGQTQALVEVFVQRGPHRRARWRRRAPDRQAGISARRSNSCQQAQAS